LIARGAIKKPDGQHKEKVQHVEFTGSFEAEDEKSRTEMINSKTTMTFSILAIAAVVLLFGSQQALAANLAGSGLVGYGGYGHYHGHYGHYHGHYGHYHGHYGHYHGHYGHYRR
jgi:hypothetical protein